MQQNMQQNSDRGSDHKMAKHTDCKRKQEDCPKKAWRRWHTKVMKTLDSQTIRTQTATHHDKKKDDKYWHFSSLWWFIRLESQEETDVDFYLESSKLFWWQSLILISFLFNSLSFLLIIIIFFFFLFFFLFPPSLTWLFPFWVWVSMKRQSRFVTRFFDACFEMMLRRWSNVLDNYSNYSQNSTREYCKRVKKRRRKLTWWTKNRIQVYSQV